MLGKTSSREQTVEREEMGLGEKRGRGRKRRSKHRVRVNANDEGVNRGPWAINRGRDER